ncbi:hypothetical protein CMUS01_14262 [Colletotrichum musicola]|uniref:Protein kinase domain-containing protein n=1 Tax=Colletotrichum musicola TaxID=2175873 RepID=A0A8H6MRW1_9PEZI|nr:hypothetical protein CMUS01_14262 [Colletotrichum musicola]
MCSTFNSMYGDERQLTLYPYTPAEPHGSQQYARNPLPPDLPSGWIRNFDPSKPVPLNRQATIKITELLSGGKNSKGQVLLCSVVSAPGRQDSGRPIPGDLKHIVAKVFDPKFYGSRCGGPFESSEKAADANLAREAGAYKYLFEHNLTGGMQLVPEYYGCWATKFKVGKNKDGIVKYRCVGLILMEYVAGTSIEGVCEHDEDTDLLIPDDVELTWGTYDDAEDEKDCLDLDLALRKAVMRMAIRGIVQHSHVGIEHFVISPKNLFITICKDAEGNLVPRTVMLDYTLTQVWCKTKYATDPNEGPQHCLQLLPHPVHPLERFSAVALEEFMGWYPLAPWKWSKKKQEYLYDKKSITTFGPLVEGKNDKGEYYSTFATLDEIQRTMEEEEEEESKMEVEEEEEKSDEELDTTEI